MSPGVKTLTSSYVVWTQISGLTNKTDVNYLTCRCRSTNKSQKINNNNRGKSQYTLTKRNWRKGCIELRLMWEWSYRTRYVARNNAFKLNLVQTEPNFRTTLCYRIRFYQRQLILGPRRIDLYVCGRRNLKAVPIMAVRTFRSQTTKGKRIVLTPPSNSGRWCFSLLYC